MPPVVPAILTADRQEASEKLAVVCAKRLSLHIDLIESPWGVPTISLSEWGALHNETSSWPSYVECHLMVDDPLKYIDQVKQFANAVVVHVETVHDISLLNSVTDAAKLQCILTAKPETTVIDEWLSFGWQIMGVTPGAAGQTQRRDTPQRVKQVNTNGRATILSVDGGVTLKNASILVASGANRLVVNSAYWQADNPDRVITSLTSIVGGGEHGVSGSD